MADGAALIRPTTSAPSTGSRLSPIGVATALCGPRDCRSVSRITPTPSPAAGLTENDTLSLPEIGIVPVAAIYEGIAFGGMEGAGLDEGEAPR